MSETIVQPWQGSTVKWVSTKQLYTRFSGQNQVPARPPLATAVCQLSSSNTKVLTSKLQEIGALLTDSCQSNKKD